MTRRVHIIKMYQMNDYVIKSTGFHYPSFYLTIYSSYFKYTMLASLIENLRIQESFLQMGKTLHGMEKQGMRAFRF